MHFKLHSYETKHDLKATFCCAFLVSCMIPASQGCNFDVVLGERKTNLTLLNCTSGCEVQLSKNKKIDRPSRFILLFSLSTHYLNKSAVIQDVVLDEYETGRHARLVRPLKHLGLAL